MSNEEFENKVNKLLGKIAKTIKGQNTDVIAFTLLESLGRVRDRHLAMGGKNFDNGIRKFIDGMVGK